MNDGKIYLYRVTWTRPDGRAVAIDCGGEGEAKRRLADYRRRYADSDMRIQRRVVGPWEDVE